MAKKQLNQKKKINVNLIRKLRNATGAPVIRVKKVLEIVDGNEKKAREILSKEGFEKVSKREGRETSSGLVKGYVHHSGKVASLIELLCETDFVAKNELFITLANDLAMQVASMNPKSVRELEKQDFIRDPGKKILDLIKEVMAKTGENVKISRFHRIELGK